MGGSKDHRVQIAVEQALDKFWEEIARLYPEIKTGDLDPGNTILMSDTMEEVVANWVSFNRPDDEPRHVYDVRIMETYVRYVNLRIEAGSEAEADEKAYALIRETNGSVYAAPGVTGTTPFEHRGNELDYVERDEELG